jgi:hypothetical protein
VRNLIYVLSMTILIPAAGGCITYPADTQVFDGGAVRTYDREMADLKQALNRGAITHEEYNHAEARLRDEFKEGKTTATFSKVLSAAEAEKYVAKSKTSAQKPIIHSVDGARGYSAPE